MLAVLAAFSISAGRIQIDLDRDWQFARLSSSKQAGFDIRGQELERVKSNEISTIHAWSNAQLPHSPWIRPLGSPEIWQGVTYYRRNLNLPSSIQSKHVTLTIEAAMQLSDLWLNGAHVATRRGGYLPLIVDLTGKLKAHNDLLVRVDNSDNPLIPPGKPQRDLDFMYGCGLYRH